MPAIGAQSPFLVIVRRNRRIEGAMVVVVRGPVLLHNCSVRGDLPDAIICGFDPPMPEEGAGDHRHACMTMPCQDPVLEVIETELTVAGVPARKSALGS